MRQFNLVKWTILRQRKQEMLDVKLNLANRKKGLKNFIKAIKAKKVLNAYYA